MKTQFVSAIREDRPITVFGDGNQTRHLTFISDVVEANLLAANFFRKWPGFNIGGGSRISVKDLIVVLETEAGKKAVISYADFQKGNAKDTLADNSDARKLPGWQPREAITDGIEKYVQWYSNRRTRI